MKTRLIDRLIWVYQAYRRSFTEVEGGKPEHPLGITFNSIKHASEVSSNLANVKKLYEASRDPSLLHANGMHIQAYMKVKGGGYENVSLDLTKIPGAIEVCRKMLIPITKEMMKELHSLGIKPERLKGNPEPDPDEVEYDD